MLIRGYTMRNTPSGTGNQSQRKRKLDGSVGSSEAAKRHLDSSTRENHDAINQISIEEKIEPTENNEMNYRLGNDAANYGDLNFSLECARKISKQIDKRFELLKKISYQCEGSLNKNPMRLSDIEVYGEVMLELREFKRAADFIGNILKNLSVSKFSKTILNQYYLYMAALLIEHNDLLQSIEYVEKLNSPFRSNEMIVSILFKLEIKLLKNIDRPHFDLYIKLMVQQKREESAIELINYLLRESSAQIKPVDLVYFRFKLGELYHNLAKHYSLRITQLKKEELTLRDQMKEKEKYYYMLAEKHLGSAAEMKDEAAQKLKEEVAQYLKRTTAIEDEDEVKIVDNQQNQQLVIGLPSEVSVKRGSKPIISQTSTIEEDIESDVDEDDVCKDKDDELVVQEDKHYYQNNQAKIRLTLNLYSQNKICATLVESCRSYIDKYFDGDMKGDNLFLMRKWSEAAVEITKPFLKMVKFSVAYYVLYKIQDFLGRVTLDDKVDKDFTDNFAAIIRSGDELEKMIGISTVINNFNVSAQIETDIAPSSEIILTEDYLLNKLLKIIALYMSENYDASAFHCLKMIRELDKLALSEAQSEDQKYFTIVKSILTNVDKREDILRQLFSYKLTPSQLKNVFLFFWTKSCIALVNTLLPLSMEYVTFMLDEVLVVLEYSAQAELFKELRTEIIDVLKTQYISKPNSYRRLFTSASGVDFEQQRSRDEAKFALRDQKILAYRKLLDEVLANQNFIVAIDYIAELKNLFEEELYISSKMTLIEAHISDVVLRQILTIEYEILFNGQELYILAVIAHYIKFSTERFEWQRVSNYLEQLEASYEVCALNEDKKELYQLRVGLLANIFCQHATGYRLMMFILNRNQQDSTDFKSKSDYYVDKCKEYAGMIQDSARGHIILSMVQPFYEDREKQKPNESKQEPPAAPTKETKLPEKEIVNDHQLDQQQMFASLTFIESLQALDKMFAEQQIDAAISSCHSLFINSEKLEKDKITEHENLIISLVNRLLIALDARIKAKESNIDKKIMDELLVIFIAPHYLPLPFAVCMKTAELYAALHNPNVVIDNDIEFKVESDALSSSSDGNMIPAVLKAPPNAHMKKAFEDAKEQDRDAAQYRFNRQGEIVKYKERILKDATEGNEKEKSLANKIISLADEIFKKSKPALNEGHDSLIFSLSAALRCKRRDVNPNGETITRHEYEFLIDLLNMIISYQNYNSDQVRAIVSDCSIALSNHDMRFALNAALSLSLDNHSKYLGLLVKLVETIQSSLTLQPLMITNLKVYVDATVRIECPVKLWCAIQFLTQQLEKHSFLLTPELRNIYLEQRAILYMNYSYYLLQSVDEEYLEKTGEQKLRIIIWFFEQAKKDFTVVENPNGSNSVMVQKFIDGQYININKRNIKVIDASVTASSSVKLAINSAVANRFEKSKSEIEDNSNLMNLKEKAIITHPVDPYAETKQDQEPVTEGARLLEMMFLESAQIHREIATATSNGNAEKVSILTFLTGILEQAIDSATCGNLQAAKAQRSTFLSQYNQINNTDTKNLAYVDKLLEFLRSKNYGEGLRYCRQIIHSQLNNDIFKNTDVVVLWVQMVNNMAMQYPPNVRKNIMMIAKSYFGAALDKNTATVSVDKKHEQNENLTKVIRIVNSDQWSTLDEIKMDDEANTSQQIEHAMKLLNPTQSRESTSLAQYDQAAIFCYHRWQFYFRNGDEYHAFHFAKLWATCTLEQGKLFVRTNTFLLDELEHRIPNLISQLEGAVARLSDPEINNEERELQRALAMSMVDQSSQNVMDEVASDINTEKNQINIEKYKEWIVELNQLLGQTRHLIQSVKTANATVQKAPLGFGAQFSLPRNSNDNPNELAHKESADLTMQ